MFRQVLNRTTLDRTQADLTRQWYYGHSGDLDWPRKAEETVQLLISYGADVTTLDMTYSTPLHLASFSGIPEIVQILIEKGSDVNALNETHSTPLHRASLLGSARSVQLLISHGADVAAQDWSHQTPLHLALSWVSAKTSHFGSSLVFTSKHNSLTPVAIQSVSKPKPRLRPYDC